MAQKCKNVVLVKRHFVEFNLRHDIVVDLANRELSFEHPCCLAPIELVSTFLSLLSSKFSIYIRDYPSHYPFSLSVTILLSLLIIRYPYIVSLSVFLTILIAPSPSSLSFCLISLPSLASLS